MSWKHKSHDLLKHQSITLCIVGLQKFRENQHYEDISMGNILILFFSSILRASNITQ